MTTLNRIGSILMHCQLDKIMSTFKDIPIIIKSGQKYETKEGFHAIKDGIKENTQHNTTLKKPSWLKIPLIQSDTFDFVKSEVKKHRLSTVCEEAKCPNISECWSHGTATIMLMGYVCTRACRFCAVDTGNPQGKLDNNEPQNTAKTVDLMNLDYVVLTSVNRDDLPDGGATHYAKAIRAIKALRPLTKVEALTPDFKGNTDHVNIILDSGLDVFAQNIETVERLTHPVRDNRAGYQQTLNVLLHAKTYRPNLLTKTSIMLGLGETDDEIIQCMKDIRAHKVDILTLGQYLQPTKNHLPVIRYVTPDVFEKMRRIGLELGFYEVASGPFVRSSYRADKVFKKEI
jgi:lipoic acid synthetase